MRTREQVSFSPLPRRSAQTKIYAGQETAKPNKKGKAVKMNIKTRLRREPLPPQQGYDKTDRPQQRTRRLTRWDDIERQEPLPLQQGYDTSTRDEMANMDDMDPSLAAADLVRDGAQFAYLQALGDAIDNNEFAVHLAAHGARDAWNRWQGWNSDDAEAEVPDSPTLMDLPA